MVLFRSAVSIDGRATYFVPTPPPQKLGLGPVWWTTVLAVEWHTRFLICYWWGQCWNWKKINVDYRGWGLTILGLRSTLMCLSTWERVRMEQKTRNWQLDLKKRVKGINLGKSWINLKITACEIQSPPPSSTYR